MDPKATWSVASADECPHGPRLRRGAGDALRGARQPRGSRSTETFIVCSRRSASLVELRPVSVAVTSAGDHGERDLADALPCNDQKRRFHPSSTQVDGELQGTSKVMIRRRFGGARFPLGAVWHPWQALEDAYTAALDFLVGFVVHGAGHWREAPLGQPGKQTILKLPRVRATLEAFEAAGQDPDALGDAVEEAVKASVLAIPDPHRSAALELLGYTIDSRGKGKTHREIRAAKVLRRSDRWLRAPNREYGWLAPRMWLLSSVAQELAADPDQSRDALAEASTQYQTVRSGSPPDAPINAAEPTTDSRAHSNPTVEPGLMDDAKIWPSFPYERICHKMAAARAQIRILVTWLPDIAPLIMGITHAVHNNASVEIMIQHPRSDALKDRLTTLGITDPNYAYYHAVKLLTDLEGLRNSAHSKQIAVRTCDVTPLGQLYATEQNIWFGFFWPDRYSLQGPQVEFSTRRSHLGRAVSEYFEKLWHSATPLRCTEDLHSTKQ